MKKYFQRGYNSDFKSLYNSSNESLLKLFIKKYFSRHFYYPIIKENVSTFYLYCVHGAFWLGILLSDSKRGK